jgi:hypothetical protein
VGLWEASFNSPGVKKKLLFDFRVRALLLTGKPINICHLQGDLKKSTNGHDNLRRPVVYFFRQSVHGLRLWLALRRSALCASGFLRRIL